jgi:probable phosphoglycerate mutase
MYPSRVVFPGGESFREAQLRAVGALETLAGRHERQRIVVVSHSDIIKLVLAHYLGMHLDLFQRIEVAPASLSILYLGTERPLVRCINDAAHLPPPVTPRKVRGWHRLRALVRRRS